MKKRLILLAVVISLFATGYSQSTIKVEKKNLITTNNGYWEGWGTSLCWWANRIGYNPALTKKSAELFFDSKKGLGLNIMRYNIGGGDDPTHNHITRTDSDVPGWQYYNAETGEYEYDYDADFRQLNVLKAASKAAGSIQKVSFSPSTNTGVAPTYKGAMPVAIQVQLGTMTSSPGPIPRALRALSKVVVPLTMKVPNFAS